LFFFFLLLLFVPSQGEELLPLIPHWHCNPNPTASHRRAGRWLLRAVFGWRFDCRFCNGRRRSISGAVPVPCHGADDGRVAQGRRQE